MTEEKKVEAEAVSVPHVDEINPSHKKDTAKDPETHEDPNWRAFREARKKDRIEKEAAERRAAEKEAEATALKAAMEAVFSKSAPQYGVTSGDQVDETEEQRIEKKVESILAQKEAQYAKEHAERERSEFPSRLKRDLPDFGSVCSQEALDYLDFHYPEISRPLQRLPDGYDKWHDIYHAVKKLIPNQQSKKDASKATANNLRPKSISSPSPSPSGDTPRESWQETERRRAENWARMQRIKNGL